MFKRLDSIDDVLSQVLNAVDLNDALSSRVEVRAPWSLHYGRETGHRAGFHVLFSGACQIVLDDDGEGVRLDAGDVVVLPHGHGHRLTTDPGLPAWEVHEFTRGLGPGESVAIANGVAEEIDVVLCGSYAFGPDGGNPLLRGLPKLMHVPAGTRADLDAAIALLAAESTATFPGSALVIDRLVNLLLVLAVRAWLSEAPRSGAAHFLGAVADPIVGPALRAIHRNPANPWTVKGLASEANLSRAAFARRFREALGEAPLAYVTRWRMTLAGKLLGDGERIASVAHQVGYGSEFAFAKAFKRYRGVAPGHYRLAAEGGFAHQARSTRGRSGVAPQVAD